MRVNPLLFSRFFTSELLKSKLKIQIKLIYFSDFRSGITDQAERTMRS